jgi:hypothetical protein
MNDPLDRICPIAGERRMNVSAVALEAASDRLGNGQEAHDLGSRAKEIRRRTTSVRAQKREELRSSVR